MLDIGGSELLVIALVLILVVGPKDLPRVLRSVGRFTAKLRGMTREFQRSIDDMAREADVEDMRKELNSVSDVVSGTISESNVAKKVEDTIDSTGALRDALKEDHGSTDEAAGKAAAKLPPLPNTETSKTEAAQAEAAPSDDVDASESAPAALEPVPAAQEEKRAQAGGAAEA